MSSCPKCGTAIDESAFGLITCESCKAVLSVDLDGNATQVEHEPLPLENNENEVLSFHESEPEQKPEAVPEPIPEPDTAPISIDPFELPPATFQPDSIQEQPLEAPQNFEPILFPVENVVEEKSAEVPSSDFTIQMSGFHEPRPEAQSPSQIFKEIADYAKGPANPNLLSYSIFFEGVENHKSEVVSALSEKKFGWSKNEIESKITGDRLILNDLNPAQAVMVVKLLQNISIRISWRQDGL